MSGDATKRVIGYLAAGSDSEVLRQGTACVVAGSQGNMRRYLATLPPEVVDGLSMSKVRLGDVMAGMHAGGTYAFDAQAYARFYPLARDQGLDLESADFAEETEDTVHFVKVALAHTRFRPA